MSLPCMVFQFQFRGFTPSPFACCLWYCLYVVLIVTVLQASLALKDNLYVRFDYALALARERRMKDCDARQYLWQPEAFSSIAAVLFR